AGGVMKDRFKVLGSIITATIFCLIAATAARADDARSGEIIETDFAPAPFSSDGQTSPASESGLPDAALPLQPVPAELIGDLQPVDSQLQPGRSGGGDVASSDGGAGDSGSGDGGSGDGGSGGGGTGDGGSGGGPGNGGKGGGHGKGGSKK
ncbi:MAG TPA: hypothetical protein VGA50_10615, partial [Kiloniellales bacterium]